MGSISFHSEISPKQANPRNSPLSSHASSGMGEMYQESSMVFIGEES